MAIECYWERQLLCHPKNPPGPKIHIMAPWSSVFLFASFFRMSFFERKMQKHPLSLWYIHLNQKIMYPNTDLWDDDQYICMSMNCLRGIYKNPMLIYHGLWGSYTMHPMLIADTQNIAEKCDNADGRLGFGALRVECALTLHVLDKIDQEQ